MTDIRVFLGSVIAALAMDIVWRYRTDKTTEMYERMLELKQNSINVLREMQARDKQTIAHLERQVGDLTTKRNPA